MLQLTDQDKKILKHLKLLHEGWRSIRIIILISSIGMVILSAFFNVERLFLLAGGIYGLSYSIAGWHGRPEISLLFKCVEAITTDET